MIRKRRKLLQALTSAMPDFNPALPKAPKVYEAREKPERGTPLGLIRKPLAEARMEQVQRQTPREGR